MTLIRSDIITETQLLNPSDHNIDLNSYRYKFIAEGDSWFSFGSLGGNSLLNELAFEDTRTLITQFARPGDTLMHMCDWTCDPNFSSVLSGKPARREQQFDALFVSAGGNDLIDAINDKNPGMGVMKRLPPGTMLESPADAIDNAAWQVFTNYLRKNFEILADMRQRSKTNRNTPIFVHTYDYATPRNAPPLGTNKTYLLPALIAHNIPAEQHWPVAQHIFEKLANIITSLNISNLHVVDTAGVLTPSDPKATGDSSDWLNEIHPNAGGYRKLAKIWREEIIKVLTNK